MAKWPKKLSRKQREAASLARAFGCRVEVGYTTAGERVVVRDFWGRDIHGIDVLRAGKTVAVYSQGELWEGDFRSALVRMLTTTVVLPCPPGQTPDIFAQMFDFPTYGSVVSFVDGMRHIYRVDRLGQKSRLVDDPLFVQLFAACVRGEPVGYLSDWLEEHGY